MEINLYWSRYYYINYFLKCRENVHLLNRSVRTEVENQSFQGIIVSNGLFVPTLIRMPYDVVMLKNNGHEVLKVLKYIYK